MNKLFIIALFLLFSSCAAMLQQYDNIMTAWKGQDEDEVYVVYGPPMSSQVLKDGRKLIAYDYALSEDKSTYRCVINFTIFEGKVTEGKYDGNTVAVSQYVKPPNNLKNNISIQSEASL